MKEAKQSTFNMVFVLGIVLLVLGVGLSVITQEVTRYRNVMGFQVPYKVTIYPYQGIGVLLALIGVGLVGASIYSKYQARAT